MTGEEFCIFSKHLLFNLNLAQTLSLSKRGKLKSAFSSFLSCFLISLNASSVHWSQIMFNNCVFTDRIKLSLLLILSKNHFIIENNTRLKSLGEAQAESYTRGIQLESSSGLRWPVTRRKMSTTHQIPRPPRVRSLPTPVPVRPRQNLSSPRKPRRML